MTTFFLDFVGGNDANNGTSFAQRWKTFTLGATAARITAGDTIRVMASSDESSLGINATWTEDSKTVTLASALTANITDCETAWTASANVTSTADATLYKENTKSAKHVIAGAFTTGLASFFATGTLDLSAYQQVSFWIQNSVAVAASSLSLRLCSDVAGVTTVNTIAIPAIPSVNAWVAFTVNTGGALGSSIQSVALYVDIDQGATPQNIFIDNIIACKAVGADALSLTSLIGKVHNLCWVASATYAANTIRKPTQPNRNGFRYKVTSGGGGAAGGSEPTWPLEIGATVVDGALTWTCLDLEDSWYPLQSINGTTVKIDNITATRGDAGRGYSGTTETVAAYKREPISFALVTSVATIHQGTTEAGTQDAPITFTGGWNTTDMTTQTGETWVSGQNGLGVAFSNAFQNNVFTNLNATRATTGLSMAHGIGVRILNCHAIGCTNPIILISGAYSAHLIGVHVANGVTTDGNISSRATGGLDQWISNVTMRRISAHGNIGNGSSAGWGIFLGDDSLLDVAYCFNNQIGGLRVGESLRYLNGIVTRGNEGQGLMTNGTGGAAIRLRNCNIQEDQQFETAGQANQGIAGGTLRVYSQDDGQVQGVHKITWIDALETDDQSLIVSATDQRHTASGISWKFLPKILGRGSKWPLFLHIAHVAMVASAQVSMQIWSRRDSTDIQGTLVVRGGQIAGVPVDVTVSLAPAINTWEQSSALTFTPTQSGVVEVYVYAWDGVGTTNSFWVDDFTVTQT